MVVSAPRVNAEERPLERADAVWLDERLAPRATWSAGRRVDADPAAVGP